MDYQIDRNEVLRYLGYSGQKVDPELEERLDAIIERAERVLQPQSTIGYFALDSTTLDNAGNPCITVLGTRLVLSGAHIYQHLSAARECALMACTLGAASEQELMRLGVSNPLDALMYDAATSALVERVADATEAQIVQEAARKNLYTNWRFSPGYDDFPLTVQPAFLSVLHAYERIGLTATTTNMLLPTKSVTAVVGLFDQRPEGSRLSCKDCHMKDFCSIRASGGVCHA